jgi:hypothetical protein
MSASVSYFSSVFFHCIRNDCFPGPEWTEGSRSIDSHHEIRGKKEAAAVTMTAAQADDGDDAAAAG